MPYLIGHFLWDKLLAWTTEQVLKLINTRRSEAY